MANEMAESAEEGFSFDDSDQFDEDSMSLCSSWLSENDLVGALTWRGWKKNSATDSSDSGKNHQPGEVLSLIELSAKVVARHFPFQAVEEYKPPIPEQIQLKVAFWSFPECEDDIQLYCCLAHGSVEEFQKAEVTLKYNLVQDVFQIGFHLSGMVTTTSTVKAETYNVAVTFDRCQIVSSTCTCGPNATWCAHITALCLFRIRFPNSVCFRVPVSESLSRLERNQLQKFAQYLINELPPQVLPTAQRLLDNLLTAPSEINALHGAPDPTAGASFQDDPKWCLDATALHDHIRKILCKFCGPSPVAFIELNSLLLTSSAPHTSLEWSNFLRPLTSREPEGIWNLLDIVRDLFKSRDSNANEILKILTEECLNFHQLALWWFTSDTEDGEHTADVRSAGTSNPNYAGPNLTSTEFAKHTGARLLSESVNLWKVALMNPAIKEGDKKSLKEKLEAWQRSVVEKARKGFSGGESRFNKALTRFNGFKPAIMAADKDWRSLYERLGINVECSPDESKRGRLKVTPVLAAACLPDYEATDDLFSCIEALYILGFADASKKLAALLAEKMLSNYSMRDKFTSYPTVAEATAESRSSSGGSYKPKDVKGLSDVVCYDRIAEGLKVAFLCKVLKECNESQHLAFKIAILGLGLPRKPVNSKSLEVKLTHCEMTLRLALKIMTITNIELELIRKYARSVIAVDSSKNINPFILATYIFEVLCGAIVQSNVLLKQGNKFEIGCQPTPEDKELGYQAAIATLGKISEISEVHYPMACESMRRQHNDLALSMLWHYKDCPEKINIILSGLLNIQKYEIADATVQPYSQSTANSQGKSTSNSKDGKKSRGENSQSRFRAPISKNTIKQSSVKSRDKFVPNRGKTTSYRKNNVRNEVRQAEVPVCSLIPPTTEDWDAEVEAQQQINSQDGGQAEGNVSGTVIGALQFDVNVAVDSDNMMDSDAHDSYSSANDSGDSISYASKQALQDVNKTCAIREEVELSNENQTDLNSAELDGACASQGSLIGDMSQMSLEIPCVSDPRILPENVVVSGLTDAASSDFVINAENASHVKRTDEHVSATAHVERTDKHVSTIAQDINTDVSSTESTEKESQSWNVDSINEWDPALSWADAVEEKPDRTGHTISGNNGNREERDSEVRQRSKNVTLDFARAESDAHALFELAKSVLLKASNGAEQYVLVSENENANRNLHRGLRLASLEIGLFSLSLQNRISPKWMSRTYSSHVSWIAGQAVDIGSTALRLLNEKWQGVLTPSEVIDICVRASRMGEPLIQRTAAELAVSCLPQAHTLNPGEIHQAVTICKDLDTTMLIRACNAIESASRAGGIQPEMLFLIARQWHYVHEKMEEESNRGMQLNSRASELRERMPEQRERYQPRNKTQHEQKPPLNIRPNSNLNPRLNLNTNTRPNQNINKDMTMQGQPPPFLPAEGAEKSSEIAPSQTFTILTPEQYVQQQMHQMAQEMLARNLAQQRGQQVGLPDEVASFSWIYPQYFGSLHHCPMPQHVLIGKKISQNEAISIPVVNVASDDETNLPANLQSAYRVGMRALEALANRGPDERANVKYSPSPPCCDDIRWLCALAASLGPHFLRRFCNSVIPAVSSPYVLHDVALEAARHFALYNPAQLASHLRSPCVSPIVIKCLAMYTELVRHELVLLSQIGYADFVDLLRRARSAFCMAPGGMTKFNELLEMVRKMYPKKRDLWHLIMNGLSKA